MSVPKSVERCSVRSSPNSTHAGITNSSLKERKLSSMRTIFVAVSKLSPLVRGESQSEEVKTGESQSEEVKTDESQSEERKQPKD